MRIVFVGTGAFGVPALRALLQAGHEIVCAAGQPNRPSGRGLTIKKTPAQAAADELRLHFLQVDDINKPDVVKAFEGAELGVVAAFGQKIGGKLLGSLPRGFINIHGSLLPKYRGAAPHQWAILNGDEVTGVTVFQLDEGLDTGPIWRKRETPIGETETAEELHDRLAQLGAKLVVETLALIECGDVKPVPQDESQATKAPKLTRADSRIEWSQPAFNVARRINGLWPWPAATCLLTQPDGKRERVQLVRAKVADVDSPPTAAQPPGSCCEDGTVQAGAGRVQLLEVQPAGRQRMSFEAFSRGRAVRPSASWQPIES